MARIALVSALAAAFFFAAGYLWPRPAAPACQMPEPALRGVLMDPNRTLVITGEAIIGAGNL